MIRYRDFQLKDPSCFGKISYRLDAIVQALNNRHIRSEFPIVALIFMLIPFFAANAEEKTKNLENCSSFSISDVGDVDLYSVNGNEFFTAGNRLHIILWKRASDDSGATSSVVSSTELGGNTWRTFSIQGKAYYLDSGADKQICSIEQDKQKWKIHFYDLDGKLLGEVVHPYEKQSREYYHFIPIPIAFPDGSIIFYSMYQYEARNPVTGLLLSLISGGH
jgi:hypothetical protein